MYILLSMAGLVWSFGWGPRYWARWIRLVWTETECLHAESNNPCYLDSGQT